MLVFEQILRVILQPNTLRLFNNVDGLTDAIDEASVKPLPSVKSMR